MAKFETVFFRHDDIADYHIRYQVNGLFDTCLAIICSGHLELFLQHLFEEKRHIGIILYHQRQRFVFIVGQ